MNNDDKKDRELDNYSESLYSQLVNSYEIENETDILQEAIMPYGEKKQGEYTLEDYYALPDDIRVELIDGVFYDMAAPKLNHQEIIVELSYQISNFIKKNKGKCKVFTSPVDVQLDRDNKTMVQPDIVILCDSNKNINRCIYGAPDFVLEVISKSTARKDYTIKLQKYKNAGVREYWILDPYKRTLVVHNFEGEASVKILGLDNPVSIGIYNGELFIDFTDINTIIDEYECNLNKKNSYDVEDTDNENVISEAVAEYGKKKQGEYTIEDYYALPDDIRVELIDGVFYDMAAPSGLHQEIIGEMGYQILDFIKKNKGTCKVYMSPRDVQLDCDDKTMVQPDVTIICDKHKDKMRCIYGAPDFVLEVISKSTARKDYTIKLKKYKNSGVKEYWILDPYKRTLVVHNFEGETSTKILGLDNPIPIGIYNGKLLIDFTEINIMIDEYESFFNKGESYDVDEENNDNVICEAVAEYGKKKQGEYTLEDYYALPDDVRVELIDGVIYDMAAPSGIHQEIAGEIYRQIANFMIDNKGKCKVFISPIDVQLDCNNKTMVQPDIVILCDNKNNINRCIYGAPDFVLEVISKSTRKKDYTIKLQKYKNAGVREYWILDPYKRTLIVHNFVGEVNTKILGLDKPVPIEMYNGKLLIDFTNINRIIDEYEYGYDVKDADDEDIICEAAAEYGKKKQGEYTLEDYYALPDDVRVELIDGVFYDMAAPTSIHQKIAGEVYLQISNFIKNNGGKCETFISPIDVQLDCDDKTMVQPDVIILCDEHKDKVRCIYGAPDFVLEVISKSTRKKDYTKKLQKYKNAGVREYWILDPYKRTLVVHNFEGETSTKILGLDNPVPIGIYNEELLIDFTDINKVIDEYESYLN